MTEAPDPLSAHGCFIYAIGGVMAIYGVLYAAFYIVSLLRGAI